MQQVTVDSAAPTQEALGITAVVSALFVLVEQSLACVFLAHNEMWAVSSGAISILDSILLQ